MELTSYLQTHPKKHLIFDFDRTLCYLDIIWDSYWTDQLQACESFADVSEYMKIDMKTLHAYDVFSTFNKIVTEHEKQALAAFRKSIEQFETTYLRSYTFNTEIISFIQTHTRDYSFYIWSNNALLTIKSILQKENLEHLFTKIATIDTSTYFKPNPDGFYSLWNPTHPKSDYLMIGDSKNDAEGAKRASIEYFLIPPFIQG